MENISPPPKEAKDIPAPDPKEPEPTKYGLVVMDGRLTVNVETGKFP